MEYKAVSLLPPVCKLLHVATQRLSYTEKEDSQRKKRDGDRKTYTHIPEQDQDMENGQTNVRK